MLWAVYARSEEASRLRHPVQNPPQREREGLVSRIESGLDTAEAARQMTGVIRRTIDNRLRGSKSSKEGTIIRERTARCIRTLPPTPRIIDFKNLSAHNKIHHTIRSLERTMICIWEFEIYEDEGFFLADPVDMDGGTFGKTFEEAVESASDCLRETVIDSMVHEKHIQGGRIGNVPLHGGRMVAVSVNCDLSRVDAVTAADAARMLDVSPARVAQMCESGLLTSWKEGDRRMVMKRSVKARMAEKPGLGRSKMRDTLEE